ncbi:MAG: hypothetical protein HY960_10350 [Ignavibacteriae bacterium]|nr:hypothetical protein [Ignavibacteriota bacterium]
MANSLTIFPGNSLGSDTSKRRLIFNGGSSSKDARSQQANTVKAHTRFNPMFMIFVVLAVAFIAVFFIWNKITVSYLLSDINRMQIEYKNILAKNARLLQEVNEKSAPDTIKKYAETKLGLTYRKERPVEFVMDNQTVR